MSRPCRPSIVINSVNLHLFVRRALCARRQLNLFKSVEILEIGPLVHEIANCPNRLAHYARAMRTNEIY